MDPLHNPFSPGAGSPPPELAGRAQILEQARITLGRIKAGRPERSLLIVGLRGVGKTVHPIFRRCFSPWATRPRIVEPQSRLSLTNFNT